MCQGALLPLIPSGCQHHLRPQGLQSVPEETSGWEGVSWRLLSLCSSGVSSGGSAVGANPP